MDLSKGAAIFILIISIPAFLMALAVSSSGFGSIIGIPGAIGLLHGVRKAIITLFFRD